MDTGISNKGFSHMTKTKDSGEDVSDFLNKLVPGLTIQLCMWGTSLGHKPNRLLDGQGGEMNVVFRGVLNITTIQQVSFQ